MRPFPHPGHQVALQRRRQLLGSGALPGEASGTIADVLDYCGSGAFMSVLAGSFRAVGRQKRDEAARLCSHYGPLIVPVLLDALAEEETQAGRRFLIGLVSHLGAGAVPEVRSRLKLDRWYVKRNALFILGEIGSEEALQAVRPYCLHTEPRVRAEAVRSLVKAGDGQGVSLLRQDLLSGDRERTVQAISMAGSFRVGELVPEIARVAREGGHGRGRQDLRAQAVRALGQIGGPEAEDTLRHILAMKSLLFRKDLEKLKGEARGALERIPIAGREIEDDESPAA